MLNNRGYRHTIRMYTNFLLLSLRKNGEANAPRHYFVLMLSTLFFLNLPNRIFFASIRVIWQDKCAESSFVIDVFNSMNLGLAVQVTVNKLSSHSVLARFPRVSKAEKGESTVFYPV